MFALLRFVATLFGNFVPVPWTLALLCVKPLDIEKPFAPRRPEKRQ